jgi:S-adenosylmethionine synthetase
MFDNRSYCLARSWKASTIRNMRILFQNSNTLLVLHHPHFIDTYRTFTSINDDDLSTFVMENFALTPNWITKKFNLDKPSKDTFLYADVAARGQVGQKDYPWEQLDVLSIFEDLKKK